MQKFFLIKFNSFHAHFQTDEVIKKFSYCTSIYLELHQSKLTHLSMKSIHPIPLQLLQIVRKSQKDIIQNLKSAFSTISISIALTFIPIQGTKKYHPCFVCYWSTDKSEWMSQTRHPERFPPIKNTQDWKKEPIFSANLLHLESLLTIWLLQKMS